MTDASLYRKEKKNNILSLALNYTIELPASVPFTCLRNNDTDTHTDTHTHRVTQTMMYNITNHRNIGPYRTTQSLSVLASKDDGSIVY